MKNARVWLRRPSPRRTHGGAWSPWSPRHRSASLDDVRESAAAPTPCAARRPLAQRPRRDQGREGRRRGMEDPRRPRAGARARARRGEGGDRPPRRAATADGTDGPTRRAAPRTTPRRPRVASRRPRARTAPWRATTAARWTTLRRRRIRDHVAEDRQRRHLESSGRQPRRDRRPLQGPRAAVHGKAARDGSQRRERGRHGVDADAQDVASRASRRGCARGRRTQRRRQRRTRRAA